MSLWLWLLWVLDRFLLGPFVLWPVNKLLDATAWVYARALGMSLRLPWLTLLFGIPVALLADRTNRVAVLTLGLAFWSGATLLASTARTFPHALIARMLVGVGEAACNPVAAGVCAEYGAQ